MLANQKLIKTNGTEILLFPLDYMYVTQGENGSYSHAGTLNLDFQGYGASGRIYKCPYYAPCSMTCVARTSTYAIWESDEKVYLVNGTTDYITLVVVHDDFPPALGTHVNRGITIVKFDEVDLATEIKKEDTSNFQITKIFGIV